MKNIGIFWGSETGNTRAAAEMIGQSLGVPSSNIRNIASATLDDLAAFDVLIIGTSTWGAGELQGDWDSFFPKLNGADFSGKSVAFFGLGDQVIYADYFQDAMGILYDEFAARGAAVVGAWPDEGYEYTYSRAVRDGVFVGLALDADNQDDLTASRISTWVAQLQGAF
ncbi:MAG: flavodoxin [Chlorobiaceae bacterium]|nr:flavodoxin [Chlorobiaceae bacterium]